MIYEDKLRLKATFKGKEVSELVFGDGVLTLNFAQGGSISVWASIDKDTGEPVLDMNFYYFTQESHTTSRY